MDLKYRGSILARAAGGCGGKLLDIGARTVARRGKAGALLCRSAPALLVTARLGAAAEGKPAVRHSRRGAYAAAHRAARAFFVYITAHCGRHPLF